MLTTANIKAQTISHPWHYTDGTYASVSGNNSGPFFFFTNKNIRVYQIIMKINEVDQEISASIICLIIKENHLFSLNIFKVVMD